MPGDGLAFAVEVGGQVDGGRVFGVLAELAQDLLAARQDFVVRDPAVVGVDAHAPDEVGLGAFGLGLQDPGGPRLGQLFGFFLGGLGFFGLAVSAGGGEIADM